MYKMLFNVVSLTTTNNDIENARAELEKAKTYVQLASENVINNDIFELNIKNAQDILTTIEEQKLIEEGVTKLNEDINIQFNKIEIFSNNTDSALYT